MNPSTLRQKLGCWLNERWRLELVLRLPKLGRWLGVGPWQRLRNRSESIEVVDGDSIQCLWQDSSMLTVAKVFPECGGRLCQDVVADWTFSTSPTEPSVPKEGVPEISVIIPVSGAGRAESLRVVLNCLEAQTGVHVELVVIEHSPVAELAEVMATRPGVYQHVEREMGAPFNKSLAMNAGALLARSPGLCFLDADCLIPQNLLQDVVAKFHAGWEAVRPIRFLFMLGEADSERVRCGDNVRSIRDVAEVQQNNPGLCACVLADVYWKIGGHDERFTGWGGEDNEFLDRLTTRRLFPGSYVPVMHLWHPPAPQKASGDRNRALYQELMAIPVAERIAGLRRRCAEREVTS